MKASGALLGTVVRTRASAKATPQPIRFVLLVNANRSVRPRPTCG